MIIAKFKNITSLVIFLNILLAQDINMNKLQLPFKLYNK